MLINDKYKNVSNDNMLNMLKDLAISLGRTPKAKETGKKYGIPSLPTYLNRFNVESWNDILELCGLEPNLITNISLEDGLQKLLDFYNKLGRLPKQTDFKKYNWYPTSSWYSKNFGGVENALIKLGLKEKPLDDEVKKEISINELKKIANDLNRCPTQEEYNKLKTEGLPLTTLIKKFNMPFTEICKFYLDKKYFVIKEGCKICSVCREEKPFEEFAINKNERRSECKVCGYLRRHKNLIIKEGWNLEEYIIVLDNILNNKIQYVDELIEILPNKNLDNIINLLIQFLKIGGNKAPQRIRKNCIICNKEFDLSLGQYFRIKCCSEKCGRKLNQNNKKIKRQKNSITIECDYCGRELSLSKRKLKLSEKHFCNKTCQNKYSKDIHREVRHCEICGESFVTLKSKVQKYCSVPCSKIAYSQNYSGENHWAYNRIITNCNWCDKEITINQSDNKRSENHFCDKECYKQWFAKICSQTDEFRNRSRENTLKMLSNGTINTTNTSIQIKINDILNNLNIKYENEKIYGYYSIDNYLNDYNLLIEVQGDYFHCNPQLFNEIIYEMQLGRVYNDRTKNKFLKNQYKVNILYLWEKDINERLEVCEKLILEYIEKKGKLKNYNSFNYSIVNNELHINKEIIKSYIDYKKADLNYFINLKVINGKYIKQRDENNWIKYNCDHCGKECESLKSLYNQKKNHFCSVQCYNLFQNKQTIIKCDNCNSEVAVKPNRLKRNKHIFCSKECEMHFKRNNKTINKNIKNVNAICDYCGNAYQVKESQYLKSKNHFCSRECRNKFKTSKIEVACDYCGDLLLRNKSQIKRSKHYFCNKNCESNYKLSNKNMDKWVEFNCEVCGEKVLKKRYDYEQSKHHFCSVRCAGEFKSNKITFNCDNCGALKTMKLSKYNMSKNHFCCYQCSVDFKRKIKNKSINQELV